MNSDEGSDIEPLDPHQTPSSVKSKDLVNKHSSKGSTKHAKHATCVNDESGKPLFIIDATPSASTMSPKTGSSRKKIRRHSLSSDSNDDMVTSRHKKHRPTPSNVKLRFLPPDNFQQLSTQRKITDDMNDDKEFWLITTPLDFDISELDNKDGVIDGAVMFNSKKHQGLKYISEMHVQTALNEADGIVTLLPDENSHLQVVGEVQRHMTVTRSIHVKSCSSERCPKSRVNMPGGLKLRYKPFGAEEPVIVTALKTKRKSFKRHTLQKEELAENIAHSELDMKNERSVKHEAIGDEEDTEQFVIDSTDSKKSKHKKRKRERE